MTTRRPELINLPEGPTRPSHPDGDRLLEQAIPRGLTLAGAVRDEGAEGVAAVTDPLSRDELVALAVALAAMVDVDVPASDLLGWVDPEPVSPQQLRAWHAAWTRGVRDDDRVTDGERRYQAWRKREQVRRAGGGLRVVPA